MADAMEGVFSTSLLSVDCGQEAHKHPSSPFPAKPSPSPFSSHAFFSYKL